MKIKFLADASLNHAIVSGVIRVEPSIDFASANSIGLEGVDDDEVLTIAALLVSQKTPVADAIEGIVMVWLASEQSEWINRICRLPF